jgi:hypothetical protein
MTIEEEKQEEALAPAVTGTEAAGANETAEHGDTGDDEPDAVPEEMEETTDEEASEELDGKKKKQMKMVAADAPWKDRMWEVFTTFWPLGLIAFGGPQAHVAILRDHLVVQRDWLDEEQFTELFAIGQVRTDVDSLLVHSLHYCSWTSLARKQS